MKTFKIIAQSEDSRNQENNTSGSLEGSIFQEINRKLMFKKKILSLKTFFIKKKINI